MFFNVQGAVEHYEQIAATAGNCRRPVTTARCSRLPIALALMALCVAIHAAGVSWALQQLRRTRHAPRFWVGTRLFVFVSTWIVLLHLAEIAVWASFYLWRDAMPDLPSALYFSAVTYTTTGYGDLVLAEGWRLLGAVER